jgi:hypothetical protein
LFICRSCETGEFRIYKRIDAKKDAVRLPRISRIRIHHTQNRFVDKYRFSAVGTPVALN